MTYAAPHISWLIILPILIVLGAAVVGVLVESFVRNAQLRRSIQIGLTSTALLTALITLVVKLANSDGLAAYPLETTVGSSLRPSHMLVVDGFSLAMQAVIAFFALLGLALFFSRSSRSEDDFTPLGSAAPGSFEESAARKKGLILTEVYPLLLFATGGMMLFTAVSDLIFAFVALEVFSLPLYVLVALARRRRLLSHEAALKYFLMGAFSSAFMLFGAALVYGNYGLVTFDGIMRSIDFANNDDALLLMGTFMVLVGLLFKLGAVPFHAWTPDAYQGAPTAVTAFMAAATKAAAATMLVRFLYVAVAQLEWELRPMLWIVAALSMVIGTLYALVQTDIKRMLAYSSVAHAGFIVVALASFTQQGISSVVFYMFSYGIATIGAFAVVSQVREATAKGDLGNEASRLGQWAGLGKRSPFLAGAMALFLLSFAGIPLTAGFIGKFAAFSAALGGNGVQLGGLYLGPWILVTIAVIASAAAAFFYIRVIVLMFFTEAPDELADSVGLVEALPAKIVIGVTAALTIIAGVMPSALLTIAADAATLIP